MNYAVAAMNLTSRGMKSVNTISGRVGKTTKPSEQKNRVSVVCHLRSCTALP
jgi:hypothetical protein